MAEITIRIPEELKELALMKRINWQLIIFRKLNEEFEELTRIKRIISKSNLSQEQADKLSDEINLSLADRYSKLLKLKKV